MAKTFILIAEDDASLAQMYLMKFTASGFKVDTASNGNEAIEKMKQDQPDIVLMDVMMPDLNGIDAIKKAMADEKTKHIPIIMLTNLSGSNDIQSAKEAGVIDYIVKSDMTPTEIVEKVQKTLKSIKGKG